MNRRMNGEAPRDGDVVICRMDHTSQSHALRVMPRPLQIIYPTYADALACAANFAALDQVDVWAEQRDQEFVLVERNRDLRPAPRYDTRLDPSLPSDPATYG